jgi:hypothetical protein
MPLQGCCRLMGLLSFLFIAAVSGLSSGWAARGAGHEFPSNRGIAVWCRSNSRTLRGFQRGLDADHERRCGSQACQTRGGRRAALISCAPGARAKRHFCGAWWRRFKRRAGRYFYRAICMTAQPSTRDGSGAVERASERTACISSRKS